MREEFLRGLLAKGGKDTRWEAAGRSRGERNNIGSRVKGTSTPRRHRGTGWSGRGAGKGNKRQIKEGRE